MEIIYSLNKIPLNTLKGINSNQTKKLTKIGLFTIQDLLLHLPLRYEDRTKLYRINNLLPGIWATVKGKILHNKIVPGNRRMLVCNISDGSGILTIRFFNFNNKLRKSLSLGSNITAYGEIKFNQHSAEIIHPDFHVQKNELGSPLCTTLTPIYPTTEGIRQATFQKLINQALNIMDNIPIAELLPPEFNCGLMSFRDALYTLHRPPINLHLNQLKLNQHPAQKRLILEELLAYNLSILALRSEIQKHNALPITKSQKLVDKLLKILPFSLTHAQLRVVSEIEHDLANNFPMMRLLQGDVGSGKTLVAALAALNVISHKKQVALMAPTELLAEQHVNSFREWFKPLGIEVGWLSGKQKGKARELQQKAIATGKISMIVGTHALFQKQVKFNRMALVIIDEQHRFGVHQRLALWEKGGKFGFYPHQLIMTATPIPRTLAMTTYADLDISIIDELPAGRIPVNTVAIPHTRREEIINRVQYACQKGRQVYWVCTIIEKSELLEAQAAEATLETLKTALPNLKIGLIHGRMNSREKQVAMNLFKSHATQLLVATTVIEVGMDIPNASLIIIENPERLGLAQLHQLRGRVGRGTVNSHCVLLYKSPLNKIAQKRLHILRHNNDGFLIAQYDLEIRGPGELLGTKQTGNTVFKVANLLRDQYIIPKVQHAARRIYQKYPEQASSLIERWFSKNEHYNNV